MWKVTEPLLIGLIFLTIISQIIVPIFNPSLKYFWIFKKKAPLNKYEDTLKKVSNIKTEVADIIEETSNDFEISRKRKEEAEKLL